MINMKKIFVKQKDTPGEAGALFPDDIFWNFSLSPIFP